MPFLRQRLALALVIVLALGASARAKDTVLGGGRLAATVIGVEVGDYCHLVVKDTAGKPRDFFVTGAPSGLLRKIIDAPAAYKGVEVTVTWQKVRTVIPEAGGEMVIERVAKVEAR